MTPIGLASREDDTEVTLKQSINQSINTIRSYDPYLTPSYYPHWNADTCDLTQPSGEAQTSLQSKVEQTAHNLQASITAIVPNKLFTICESHPWPPTPERNAMEA